MTTLERAGNWVQVVGGKQFWPMSPRPEDVEIEAIAHARAAERGVDPR